MFTVIEQFYVNVYTVKNKYINKIINNIFRKKIIRFINLMVIFCFLVFSYIIFANSLF